MSQESVSSEFQPYWPMCTTDFDDELGTPFDFVATLI